MQIYLAYFKTVLLTHIIMVWKYINITILNSTATVKTVFWLLACVVDVTWLYLIIYRFPDYVLQTICKKFEKFTFTTKIDTNCFVLKLPLVKYLPDNIIEVKLVFR